MGNGSSNHVSIRLKKEIDVQVFRELKEVTGIESNVGLLRKLMLFYMNQSPAYRHASMVKARKPVEARS